MERILGLILPIMALSIPLVIVTGRFLVQPITLALSKATERSWGGEETEPLERRLARTEEQLEAMERALRHVAEAQDFPRQLAATRTARTGDT